MFSQSKMFPKTQEQSGETVKPDASGLFPFTFDITATYPVWSNDLGDQMDDEVEKDRIYEEQQQRRVERLSNNITEYLRSDSPIPNTINPEYSNYCVEKSIADVAEKTEMKSKLNPNAPVFNPVGSVLSTGRKNPNGDMSEVVERKLNPNAPTFHPTSSPSSSTSDYDNNNNEVLSPLPGSDIPCESFKN